MKRFAGALALALAAGPATAQEGSDLAPGAAPVPSARPKTATDADVQPALIPPDQVFPLGEAVPDDEAAGPVVDPDPVPEVDPPAEAPGDAAPAGGSAAPTAEPAPADTDAADGSAAEPPPRTVPAETPEELAACLSALDDLGAHYAQPAPITDPDDPACGIPHPVTLEEVAGVAFDPPTPTRCATALAAALWVTDGLRPLSRLLDRGGIQAVEQGPAYVCRPRADGEVSDHSFGNALDVIGFRFAEGGSIPVEPRAGDGTPEEAFQRAARAAACLAFTTVLGPGEPDHETHLHLDVKAREGGFRICQ